MDLYLSNSIVDYSFGRLSPHKTTGKTHLERTSALAYFLAFDATVKKLGKDTIDLNPLTFDGKNNRETIALEFVRLVQLKNSNNGQLRQVSVLGKVEIGGAAPEKRISSNFLTVPLKKASQSSKHFLYPSRPAPVLKMGPHSTGLNWGVSYFENWRENLPKLLSETKSNTPFTDLAVFTLRDSTLTIGCMDLISTLCDNIALRFTTQLSLFWKGKLEAEKVFLRLTGDWNQTTLPGSLSDDSGGDMPTLSTLESLRELDTEALINRILYLEKLLESQHVPFKQFKC